MWMRMKRDGQSGVGEQTRKESVQTESATVAFFRLSSVRYIEEPVWVRKE